MTIQATIKLHGSVLHTSDMIRYCGILHGLSIMNCLMSSERPAFTVGFAAGSGGPFPFEPLLFPFPGDPTAGGCWT